jgi:predicted nuclease with TOPRIM domain
MAEEPKDFVLEYLRRIDRNVETLRNEMIDVKARLSSLEEQVVHLRKDFVRLEHRFDHFEERLERIERRLELA